jgi:glycosyltransferase involved in cell wall biosynthesis
MNPKPFFSVLVPTYNQAQYLGQALNSLIEQTNINWEAIIINDGSTDSTSEVIELYCKKDVRFKSIYKENGGVGSALNKGLDNAQGEWVCWLSSDDLFDYRKLEIHQDWINKFPNTHFFFSHFKYLNDETGEISNPPLWLNIPTVKWQILEILKCPFLHGNSICIHRESWNNIGNFNESLRYGQDYDMWLRLLAHYAGMYIPERTCTTRFHPSQDSNRFPQAGFYDSAKAGIQFLNLHKFNELIPLLDLTDPEQAIEAVNKALDIAGNYDGILYSLGSHPALIWRVIEWVWNNPNPQIAFEAKQLIKNKSAQLSRKYFDLPFGFLWQAINLACKTSHPNFDYQYISPTTTAELNYWWKKSKNYTDAESLSKYLEKFDQLHLDSSFTATQGEVKEIFFIFQQGAEVDSSFKYGALRATIEIAKYLQRTGRKVLLTGKSSQSMGLTEGVMFVGATNDLALSQALESLQLIDTVVLISRADFLLRLSAMRFLVYHHGPHPIISAGDKSQKINLTRTPVICVSHSSRDSQVTYGIEPDLIHVVPNSYDHSIFYPNEQIKRLPHSLIFAGHIVGYKGVDIALQAFIEIKNYFADAVLNICGSNEICNDAINHYFPTDWLDSDGFPIWKVIEEEMPGVKYCGELSSSNLSSLFCQTSILITPSRIPETFGLVSLEAQACGCIPVLPRKGGFPETLQENETGYLYDENTPKSLTELITSLWQQELPTENQRNDAQDFVRQYFSWEVSGEKVLNILESPVSNSKISLKTKVIYNTRKPIYFLEKVISTIKDGIFLQKLRGYLLKKIRIL